MPSADTETRDDRRAGGRAGGLPPPRRRRAAGGGQGGGELRCPALQVTPRPLLLDTLCPAVNLKTAASPQC